MLSKWWAHIEKKTAKNGHPNFVNISRKNEKEKRTKSSRSVTHTQPSTYLSMTLTHMRTHTQTHNHILSGTWDLSVIPMGIPCGCTRSRLCIFSVGKKYPGRDFDLKKKKKTLFSQALTSRKFLLWRSTSFTR